MSIEQRVDWHW